MSLRRAFSISSLVTAFACASLMACSGSPVDEDEEADEGALSLSASELLESVFGEVSKGRTLPANFSEMSDTEKRHAVWSMASRADQLRCGIGRNTYGTALVEKLENCNVGTGPDDLRAATLSGSLARASYQVFMGVLGASGTLSAAFDTPGDELPMLRKKLLHPFGSVALVELRVEKTSPYTGVLRPGTVASGIARLSTGGPEKLMGFVPGLGLKLFINGGTSVDLHVLNSLGKQLKADGQTPDYNFFSRPLSNEIVRGEDGGALAIVEKIFSRVHPTPMRLPIDHLSRRAVGSISGPIGPTIELEPKGPANIVFDPPADLTETFNRELAARPGKDPLVALSAVTKDATFRNPVLLYRVRAGTATEFQKADKATVDEKFPVIATLVATEPFLPSKWGDSQLYMRHNRGCEPVVQGAKTVQGQTTLCADINDLREF